MSEGLAQGPYVAVEWDSNLQPFGGKAPNLTLSHHAPWHSIGVLTPTIHDGGRECVLSSSSALF